MNREKIDSGYGYEVDCVVDECGELSSERTVENSLQNFYNKTGVQPFVYLKAFDPDFDPAMVTQDQREEWAQQLFDDRNLHEGTFLLVMFENSRDEVYLDYTVYIVGQQCEVVMDAEACEILEHYFQNNWYNDSLSTDEVIVNSFNKTASRIMTRTTTSTDIAFIAVIGVVSILVVVGVAVILIMVRKHAKERNEEIERILSTPLGNVSDPTLEKYEEDKTNGDP